LDALHKILILGHSGFIGKSLYNYFKTNINFLIFGASSNECNLLDLVSVTNYFSTIEGPIHIIICSVINKHLCNNSESLHKNIEMIDNLLSCAKQKDIRSIIYLSSVDVYGQNPQLPINEKTLINPLNIYGLSKFSCEFLLRESNLDFPVTILRLPGVYGKGDNLKSIVGLFVKKIYYDNQITLFDEGKILRDYLEINDLCHIIKKLIVKPGSLTLNIATGNSLALKDIANIIIDKISKRIHVEYIKNSTNSAMNLVFDNSALINQFPELRLTDINTGCELYINNFIKNKK